MIKKLDAFIINNKDLNETDTILTILTEDGIKDVYGRGYRNIKNKYHALVNRGIHVTIYGYDKKNFFAIKDFDILKFSNIITDDYQLYLEYIKIIKLILSTKELHDKTSLLLFEYTIDNLEEIPAQYLFDFWKIFLLKKENFILDFSCCQKCGNVDQIITINSYEGGLICQRCYNGEKVMKFDEIKALKLLFNSDLNKLYYIKYSQNVSKFLSEILQQNSGIYL